MNENMESTFPPLLPSLALKSNTGQYWTTEWSND